MHAGLMKAFASVVASCALLLFACDGSPSEGALPSGGAGGFTPSLIYGNRLREIIATLKGRYDKIVFDSPPIIGVSDASVLASAVDGAALLIQYRRNPQSMVLRAQQIVESLKTTLIGVVLNQVPLSAGGDYGYYTNNYAYYSDATSAKSRRSADRADAGMKSSSHGEKDRLERDATFARVAEEIRESVRHHLEADVPVGA